MFDQVEEERGGESRLDNVRNERGNISDHLSTEGDGKKDTVDVDGEHLMVIDEDRSEPKGHGVHEKDERLGEGKHCSVGLRLPQVLPKFF